MRAVAILFLALQFGTRTPFAPAETLLSPDVFGAIASQAPLEEVSTQTVGTDPSAEILLTCGPDHCAAAARAARKINALVSAKRLAQPTRSIRVVSERNPATSRQARAAIHLAEIEGRPLQVLRGLWSTAAITDEVVELLARHGGGFVDVRAYEDVGQLRLEAYGVPTTTIVSNPAVSNDAAAITAAAAVYFLATLPNDGAESLLAHLTVGAHARLAEDGRRAVAMMGHQQRATADVLILLGQAIEREQRRMRSFERFMPDPVDPMLHRRIADMERGITSVWGSLGITSSPFIPPADRIRGRGGEDRRIATRQDVARVARFEALGTLAKLPNAPIIAYEIGNLTDGKRSISDIRDVVSAEFGAMPLAVIVDYFGSLEKAGAVSIR